MSHSVLQPPRLPPSRHGRRPPGVPAAAGRDRRPPARHRPGHRADAPRRAAGRPEATWSWRTPHALRRASCATCSSRSRPAASSTRARPRHRRQPRHLEGRAARRRRCGGGHRRGDRRPSSRTPSAPCARPATTPRATRPWASASSTTWRSRRATRWTCAACKRVAIVDFDVHHGNGTEDILAGDERVLMVSFFQHPLYPYSGARAQGHQHGQPADPAVHARRRVARDDRRAVDAARWRRSSREMIFISAGFDAHREDDLGQLGLVEADYEWITLRIKAWPSATPRAASSPASKAATTSARWRAAWRPTCACSPASSRGSRGPPGLGPLCCQGRPSPRMMGSP